MILSKKSSAWLLCSLQFLLAILFTKYLSPISGTQLLDLFQGPTWYVTLITLLFGTALLLALVAYLKFELTAITLLIMMQIICPIIFFTDLTRNPYFTQIVLLNIWIAFIWMTWFWDCFVNQKFIFPKTVLDLPFFIFFIIVTISWGVSFMTHVPSFYSSMFYEGIKSWLFLIVNVYGVFYIAVMLDAKWRSRFIWLTFWVGGIAAVYGLMQFYGIEKVWQKSLTPFGNRPVSTFGNPNFLSSYLLLLVPLLVACLMTTKKTVSILYSFLLLIILITGIIATMTRSTWVGTILAISLLPLVDSVRDFMKKNHKKLLWIVLILVASVIFWPKSKLGGYENPWQRVVEIKNMASPHGHQPWHQRMLIWSCCWRMVNDHLMIGKGWGLLELFYPYYQGPSLFHPVLINYRTHANNAHNEVIEIWSQTGSLGMGIYTWIWVIIVLFGFKSARYFWSIGQSEKSIYSWALTAGALGMFVDNFLGNVSLHFAVPAMLFWWQIGFLFGFGRSEIQNKKMNVMEWYVVPIENNLHKSFIAVGMIFLTGISVLSFSKEFQEIHYFRGFKISKSPQYLDQARIELEKAWKWYSKEVSTNYELSNNYARLAQQSAQMGLTSQSENWRKKALWGYIESLNSNCGYDEIYFNLATTQVQTGWHKDDFQDLSVENPNKMNATFRAAEVRGSIYNFSRAIAINPLSHDAYTFLGNLYLRDPKLYGESGIKLFEHGNRFFPRDKDFLINLSYLQIQSKKFEEGYLSLKKALTLDPYYELTRKNIRSILAQMNKTNDPLLEVEQALMQLNPLFQSKDWNRLRLLFERSVQILPDCSQIHFVLANVYFELKLIDKAEKEYLEVLRIDAYNLNALTNLATVYRLQNKIEDAKKIYQRLLQIKPEDPQFKAQLQSL